MLYVGIDLHKKTIALCVVNQARAVVARKTLLCAEPARIQAFFAGLDPFQAVVEATASYEWLWEMLEPRAQRLVLAHPKKLRVIAESTRKSDRLDAQVLAEFLALDMIPQAYRPTPRQRQHRTLVRQRCSVRRGITAVKNKLRRLASNYNADRKDLFTAEGGRRWPRGSCRRRIGSCWGSWRNTGSTSRSNCGAWIKRSRPLPRRHQPRKRKRGRCCGRFRGWVP